MIGPTSGSSSVPNREVTENPIRIKRKVFEDLDIENFCEDVYQGGRKRYMTELQVSSEGISQISNANFSQTVEEALDMGSVARLEVLVVDGTWDTSELENATLTDISQSQIIHTNGQFFTQINGEIINQNLGGCQNFWEPPQPSQTPPSKHSSTRGSSCQFPRFQENNPGEDQENGNLSWLLDFKLDSFIEAADKSTILSPKENQSGQKNRFQTNIRPGPSTSFSQDPRKLNFEILNPGLPREGNSFGSVSENRNVSRYNGPKKPPFTYTELIEHALQEKGELTVSAIYQWISEHFPYYKSNDDRWKNSVRHNLSINPHFRKGSKAPHGAGHLWAIANQEDLRSRHILSNGYKTPVIESNNYRKSEVSSQIVTMDEVEAATASIAQPPDEETENIINSVTLEHCAEQILSGIKREVEVQYLVPMAVPRQEQNSSQQNNRVEQHCPVKETDFLNPVSKEVVAEECGLIGEGYLVTDLTPAALGLNIVDPDMISPDNLFGEELSFQFYEFTSSSQLQSA
ncbi:uncharacterized protein LOC117172707 [Belonocnema kinseyi]|uniref:uncharacterized protein LOC117172707 n=1 Tax=Belonocnema kinseyi TaxID=2817044 RepID=UPI00143D9CF9|nr:uncharacterized protein LOC117172707 [Belonocnema kinseyi]